MAWTPLWCILCTHWSIFVILILQSINVQYSTIQYWSLWYKQYGKFHAWKDRGMKFPCMNILLRNFHRVELQAWHNVQPNSHEIFWENHLRDKSIIFMHENLIRFSCTEISYYNAWRWHLYARNINNRSSLEMRDTRLCNVQHIY